MGKVEDISVPGGLTVLTQLLASAINNVSFSVSRLKKS
jgi:hypothetical protein